MTSAYGTDDIWNVFDDSIVVFDGPDGTPVRYGTDPCPYPEPLFGVTGWNPGEDRPRDENERANERLGERLTALGIRHVDAVGSSPDGTWQEPGFVLIGTDQATALSTADEFGQLAIHEMSEGRLLVVSTGRAPRPDKGSPTDGSESAGDHPPDDRPR